MDKQQKTAVMIAVEIPNDSKTRKGEYEKLENYQGLQGELERICKVKAKVVPVVTGDSGL